MSATTLPEPNSDQAQELCRRLTGIITEDGYPIFEVAELRKYTVREKRGYAKRELSVGTRLKLVSCYTGKREPLIFVFKLADYTAGSFECVEVPYKDAQTLDRFATYVESLLDDEVGRTVETIREEKKVLETDTESANWNNPEFGSW